MKCQICGREAQEKGFCLSHLKAYENILQKFELWKKASETDWMDYLVEIQKNSLTGEWAKEVIMQLIKGENANDK